MGQDAAASKNTINLLYDYYKAMGGRPHLENLRTLKLSGKVDAVIRDAAGNAQTLIQDFELWLAQPSFVRFNIRTQETELVRGWDGHFSWIVIPSASGNRDASAAPAETHEGLLYLAAIFDNVYSLERKGFVFTAGPDETVDGVSYKVLSFKNARQGLKGSFMLDSKTLLPKYVRVFPHFGDRDHAGLAVLSDWRAVDGVMYPFRMAYSEDGTQQFTLMVEHVRPNVTAPNFYFVMPGRDVQWLELEKQRKKAEVAAKL